MGKYRVTGKAGTQDAMQHKKKLAMKTKSKDISIAISHTLIIHAEIVLFGISGGI
jgi:N-acetylglutamate synthase/N-acetylornithine aminotransferase